MTGRQVLAVYDTPSGNVVTLLRQEDPAGWLTQSTAPSGSVTTIFIDRPDRAREHYELAEREGLTFGPFV